MKRYKVVACGPNSDNQGWLETAHNLRIAAIVGWPTVREGLRELRALTVGGRVVDTDGDTWERIA